LTIGEVAGPFGRLPDTYNGWIRHDDGRGVNTKWAYWKATSTHCNARYTCLRARECGEYKHTAKTEIALTRTKYDQFGHTVSQDTPSRGTISDADRIWSAATGIMDAHPGKGEFESPPEMPAVIGEWELIEQTHCESRWERGFGMAELVVEQTDVIPQYCSTRYEYAVRYREIDACREAVDIVTGVPRQQAFEIGVHTLQQLHVPLSECQAMQHTLEGVKGIGPAKARQLIILGIGSPGDLHDYLTAEESGEYLVNYHHSEAVDTILTSQIRESMASGDGQQEGE
jgi:hypothetical protein